MDVNVVVRGELELRIDDLPPLALDLIKSALSFPNEDREAQAREQVFGWWDLPETIDLWRLEKRRSGEVLLLPRGFARQLGIGLASLDARPVWDDQRVAPKAAEGYFRPFLMRDYQSDAAIDLLRAEQGFFEGPAGSGKTVTMLGLSALAGLRTLVIIDKADIVDQWREEAAKEWLDEAKTIRGLNLSLDFGEPRSSGKIGQGVWEERDLTIALRQALWSRIDELDATRWWDQWGLTIYDEGHHLAADTLHEIARRTTSRMELGTSATPARTPMKGKIVHALVGPVVHRTSRQTLRDRGILVMPRVEQVVTDFYADFWDTHTVNEDESCKMPGCKKSGKKKHSHRNNYSSVVKKLVEDDERNKMIAAKVVEDQRHVHLLPSRQLKHLDLLKKAIEAAGWEGPIFYLRGEENAKGESRDIVQQIKEGASDGCVILSTVADEALDIPPIDRIHLTFPMRQEAGVEQLVGRGERATEGKDGCIVFDYVDPRVDVFAGQAAVRERVYRRQGYPVAGWQRKREPVRFSSGPYSSFSDQWPIDIEHPLDSRAGDITVITREHLFQAEKTTDLKMFNWVLDAPTALEAKTRGQQVPLRADWEDVKFDTMVGIIHTQCSQHPELVDMLQATGDAEIIESRPDPIWGEGRDGKGKNLLGKAWMKVRAEQRETMRAREKQLA